MFPVLLAKEDCSIKRGQPSITRESVISNIKHIRQKTIIESNKLFKKLQN